LYNVKTDVSETHDLAQEQPELAQKMLKKLKSWQKETGALMPVPNPNYDSEKPFRNSVTAWKGENRL
jgi:hypothetical protein